MKIIQTIQFTTFEYTKRFITGNQESFTIFGNISCIYTLKLAVNAMVITIHTVMMSRKECYDCLKHMQKQKQLYKLLRKQNIT